MAQSAPAHRASPSGETVWPAAINELLDQATYVGKAPLLAREREARLRAEVDAYLRAVDPQQADFTQFRFVTCLQRYLDSDLVFADVEQVREYARTVEVQNEVPWFLELLQSLWHLGHDLLPALVPAYQNGVAVFVPIFNETRFAHLCLKSIRGLGGFPARVVAVNNSTLDMSGFRKSVLGDGLADEWVDTGTTWHGDGLQLALSRAGDWRYVATIDSDAVGLRPNWLGDLVQELEHAQASLIGAPRASEARDIVGYVIHPSCLVLDRQRIGASFPIDFRSQWPFWDVGGLLTWDCVAHGLPIVRVSAKHSGSCAESSTLINSSVRHYWYVSRISTLNDNDELDGHRVGEIRARLDRDYASPELDAIKRLAPCPRDAALTPPAHETGGCHVSVVLTTFNRPQLLAQVLEGFAVQTVRTEDFEVVVVDDGSLPPVQEIVDRFSGRMRLQYLRQENAGLAAARNVGIRAARGALVLFSDDDDVPGPELVAQHLRSHREYPDERVAVLGHLDWHPDLDVTPLMHYVTHVGGEYFGFDRMQDGQFYDQWKWWGGLVSAKRTLLQSVAGPFDPRLCFGYEDTELACRLADRHIRVLYNARARSYVLKPVTFEEFCRRSYKQGKALQRVAATHPQVIIARYHLDQAAGEYRDKYAAHLEPWQQKTAQFEAMVAAQRRTAGAVAARHLQPLYTGYRECFRGYVLKGYVEQLEAAARGEVSLDQPVNVEGSLSVPGTAETLESARSKSAARRSRIRRDSPAPDRPGTPAVRPLRLAFVDTNTPCYDMGSSCLRVHHIARILAAQGHRLDYLYTNHHKSDKKYKAAYDGAVNFIKTVPSVTAFRDYLHFNGVEALDAVWITNLWALEYTDFALQLTSWLRENRPGTKVIIDTMDLHYKKFMRRFELSGQPQDRQIAEQFLELEKRLYPLADRVLAVTEVEKRDILDHAGACQVEVIPNVHPTLAQGPDIQQRRHMCFLGAFRIRHNLDAVQWFLKEVHPLILQNAPDVQFHILGYGNEEFRETFEAYPNVRVVGYVDDAERAVAQYRLFVCPMLYGAGMKGKLGVAAAAGTPFVTTTIGAEGFGFADGQHCFIADEPAQFADRCVQLMRDDALWQHFHDQARELLRREFSVEAVSKRLVHLLESCMSEDAQSPTPGVRRRMASVCNA